MSLFTWFSRKSNGKAGPRGSEGEGPGRGSRPAPARNRAGFHPASRAETDSGNRGEARKARRHARREQLYVAVRESMTRAGVLASSYKFKVLSLDQHGNQFLAMMDVATALGRQTDKLADIESMITRTARARFEIQVTAVYWRTEMSAIDRLARPPAPDAVQVASPAASPVSQPAALKSAGQRYEPIQDDEVAAFKQALAAASAASPIGADAVGKSRRSGLHSYTLFTGFEDTEMLESGAAPALSTTQYGDLN